MKIRLSALLIAFTVLVSSCSAPADTSSKTAVDSSSPAASEAESQNTSEKESQPAESEPAESGTADPGQEASLPAADSSASADSSAAAETEYPALRELACLQDLNMIEAIVPAQDGRILVYGDTDNGTVYCLVDPESEMVITRSETEQPFGIPFAVRADGEVLTMDPDEGALCCLDSSFHLVKTIPVQGSAAVYSSSENCAYILNGGNLVRVSPEGTTEAVLSFHNWAQIIAVNPETKSVLVRENVESSILLYHYLVYTFDKELLYTIEDNGSFGFAGKTVTGFSFSAFGMDPMSDGALLVYGIEKNAEPAVYRCSSQMELENCAASPLTLIHTDTYTDNGDSFSAISLFDPQNGACLPVKAYNGGCYLVTSYDEGTGCILVGASTGDGCEVLIINPSALTESEELQSAVLPEPSTEAEITLPDYLKEARALADTLEQRYGICIRLSTQADPLSPDGYEVHSTTELSPDEESAALISSLNRLDGILSVYPQEFYETFKTETGLGGLRFGFFASMRKPDLIAAGVTVQTAAWYNIFLDVNNSSDAVIHHEIWHAVEKRAEGDGFIISDTEWSSYNPDGFFYRDETDTPLPTDRSTILVYGAGDASSFVEEYSTYAMHEDRATIIEYFFQDGQDYLEQYDTLTAAPLLKKKLDLMAAVTRPVFGTVYWEDIAQALKNGS